MLWLKSIKNLSLGLLPLLLLLALSSAAAYSVSASPPEAVYPITEAELIRLEKIQQTSEQKISDLQQQLRNSELTSQQKEVLIRDLSQIIQSSKQELESWKQRNNYNEAIINQQSKIAKTLQSKTESLEKSLNQLEKEVRWLKFKIKLYSALWAVVGFVVGKIL